MKTKIFAAMISLLVSVGASAQNRALGDRWPWSWGMECPFSTSIEGDWFLEARGIEEANDGHLLEIDLQTERISGRRTLVVSHYDKRGRLIAVGDVAILDDNQRLIEMNLRHQTTGKIQHRIILRSYVFKTGPELARTPDQNTCFKRKKAYAVTFCPVGGRKCMEESHYLMERIP